MIRTWLAIICSALLAGCSVDVDPRRVEQSDQAYRQIAEGRVSDFLRGTEPVHFDPLTSPAQVRRLGEYIPDEPTPEGRPIRWFMTVTPEGETYELLQEYDYPEHVAIFSAVMVRQGGDWKIAGVHVQVATDEELAPTRAIVSGKPAPFLILLALGAVVLGLCVVTPLFALWRRRWLWAPASAVGLGAYQVNWLTGEWAINLLNLQIFGVGMVKGASAFDPWIFSLSAPVGAILFWALGRWKPKAPRTRSLDRRPGELA